MLFEKPTMKNPSKAGYLEGYLLESGNVHFSIHTVVGGYEYFDGTCKVNRNVFVLRGTGDAVKMPQDALIQTDLQEGSVVQVQAGQAFKMDGQFRFALMEGNGEFKVRKNSERTLEKSGDDSTLLFVTKGAGNLYMDDKVYVLREETLVEIPANTVYELRGNFDYIALRA